MASVTSPVNVTGASVGLPDRAFRDVSCMISGPMSRVDDQTLNLAIRLRQIGAIRDICTGANLYRRPATLGSSEVVLRGGSLAGTGLVGYLAALRWADVVSTTGLGRILGSEVLPQASGPPAPPDGSLPARSPWACHTVGTYPFLGGTTGAGALLPTASAGPGMFCLCLVCLP